MKTKITETDFLPLNTMTPDIEGARNSFISDLTNSDSTTMFSGVSRKPKLQYKDFHQALMTMNFFGKIVPECEFTLFENLCKNWLSTEAYSDYDCYYLDKMYLKLHDIRSQNGLFLLIPKNYSSQSKNHISIVEVSQTTGTPCNTTMFYFPYVQNVFKSKIITSKNPAIDMFADLISAALVLPYRQTKISKQRDVHPTLSYYKTRL